MLMHIVLSIRVRIQGVKYHYFDKQQAFTWVHSFELAVEVFRRIGDFYPVRVH